MDTPRKPVKVSLDLLKSMVEARTKEERGIVEPEAPLNDSEVERLRQIVTDDYEKLVATFGLSSVLLDVYSYSELANARTPLGTAFTNCTPLYDLYKIVLPLHPSTIREEGIADMPFPPTCWDMFSPTWPKWRMDLWHEVLHQVEDQIYDTWEGGEIHGPSYMRVIVYAAAKLKSLCIGHAVVAPAQLRVLMLGDSNRKNRPPNENR